MHSFQRMQLATSGPALRMVLPRQQSRLPGLTRKLGPSDAVSMKTIGSRSYSFAVWGVNRRCLSLIVKSTLKVNDGDIIWNLHHLDKTRQFVYTIIYQTGMVYTCIYGIKEMMAFQLFGCCFPVESCRYTLPTYSTKNPGASSAK
jgi:hypothetical protein